MSNSYTDEDSKGLLDSEMYPEEGVLEISATKLDAREGAVHRLELSEVPPDKLAIVMLTDKDGPNGLSEPTRILDTNFREDLARAGVSFRLRTYGRGSPSNRWADLSLELPTQRLLDEMVETADTMAVKILGGDALENGPLPEVSAIAKAHNALEAFITGVVIREDTGLCKALEARGVDVNTVSNISWRLPVKVRDERPAE